MTILVAPSEPPELRALGDYSPLAERYGCDVLFLTEQGQMVGVQRKEIHDLVSSLGERLNRELAKAAPCDVRVLLIEGEWRWTANGESLAFGSKYGRVLDRRSYDGLIRSVQHLGYWVVTTDNLLHTVEWVTHAAAWFDRSEHTSLNVRGNGPRDMFGSRDHTYQRTWLWQSFEGIGAIQAKELDAYFNGIFPAAWAYSYEDWMKMAKPDGCKGIGVKRAQALWDAFQGQVVTT